ncbi:MAG: hypothetical protein NWF04_00810 [Candidatus Bathyarchaeota archaeon]|nr:hypothetical protein [Candidatus Bathyarchaeota archaeon]
MNRSLKILIALSILLAMAALAVAMTAYTISQSNSYEGFPFRRTTIQFVNPADIELYYVARTVFSIINITLLMVLVINYASIYLKTRSDFTIGLLLFSVFFLIKDVMWSPFVIGAFGFGMFGLGPFAFLPDTFELIALSVLLYLSVKY